jgi:hypothetical protein
MDPSSSRRDTIPDYVAPECGHTPGLQMVALQTAAGKAVICGAVSSMDTLQIVTRRGPRACLGMTSVSWLGKGEIRSRSRSKGTLEATTESARLVYQPPGYGREYFCKCTRCHPTVSYLCALADFRLVYPTVFQLTFCLAGISLSRSCHVTKKKKPGLFRARAFQF